MGMRRCESQALATVHDKYPSNCAELRRATDSLFCKPEFF
jgi:hypothetical protein